MRHSMQNGGRPYQRTRNSLHNSIVAVGFQILILLVGFWSRRIFLNHLGTEVLGLNSTAQSMLGFLNLAELGIGSAVAVTLYKPIFEDNRQEIREIVALQGWLYKIIALIVLGGSVLMMCLFPAIFSKTELPLWYAYAAFGICLYGSILGYFFNYKQIVLDAYQWNYKIQFATKTVVLAKLVAQAFAVKYLDNGFVWWLAIEAVASTVSACILSWTVRRTVPFISETIDNPAALKLKYPQVITKVKQIFVHKFSGFVTNQAAPILIYAFASMTMVANYGNYLLITNNLTKIFDSMLSGLSASVGNMVAEGDRKSILKVFRELFSFRFAITAVCCICLWFLTEPFLTLWIGDSYLLGKGTLVLLIILFYISGTRSITDTFLNAYGLFKDVWAPIVQAALTLCLSITLGFFYDLNGILSGFVIAQFLIIKVWKPFFLFRNGLKEPFSVYSGILAKHLGACVVTIFVVRLILNLTGINPAQSFISFIVSAFTILLTSSPIMFGLLYLSEQGMRDFVSRLKKLS